MQGETENYEARKRALDEAVAANSRSIGLLVEELNVADTMARRGLMSDVEVMRVRRQVNDLRLANTERINRFRQEASAELVRVRTELALLEEQMVVREDAPKRTVLVSPVNGIVKQIRNNTVGGVVGAGAPIMEIVPIGTRVLVEARIKPADIGFVKVGQPVARSKPGPTTPRCTARSRARCCRSAPTRWATPSAPPMPTAPGTGRWWTPSASRSRPARASARGRSKCCPA
ncbi:MAG: HlyD family efflux transporter periplasmic adaptor subunit [Rubrivivax sp.]